MSTQFVETNAIPWPVPGPALRERLATYLLVHQSQIREMARLNLTSSARKVCDSEDVLSSVLRRLDEMASDGALRPRSERELWALIRTIARNTAVSRTRLIEHARQRLTEDGPYAYELLQRLNAFRSDEEATLLVHRMLASVGDRTSRQVLALVMRGASHRAIGAFLEISEDASRQRWMVVRRELGARFGRGELDG